MNRPSPRDDALVKRGCFSQSLLVVMLKINIYHSIHPTSSSSYERPAIPILLSICYCVSDHGSLIDRSSVYYIPFPSDLAHPHSQAVSYSLRYTIVLYTHYLTSHAYLHSLTSLGSILPLHSYPSFTCRLSRP